jgi:hypothetical protein
VHTEFHGCKKDIKLLVSQQCLLNFQMGDYEDQVLCDVVAWMLVMYCWVDLGCMIGEYFMMG